MKKVIFSKHAKDQMADRGATEDEVIKSILEGEKIPAKKNRQSFRKNFTFGKEWKNKIYETKQVVPVVVEEEDKIVVVTVFVYYFGG